MDGLDLEKIREINEAQKLELKNAKREYRDRFRSPKEFVRGPRYFGLAAALTEREKPVKKWEHKTLSFSVDKGRRSFLDRTVNNFTVKKFGEGDKKRDFYKKIDDEEKTIEPPPAPKLFKEDIKRNRRFALILKKHLKEARKERTAEEKSERTKSRHELADKASKIIWETAKEYKTLSRQKAKDDLKREIRKRQKALEETENLLKKQRDDRKRSDRSQETEEKKHRRWRKRVKASASPRDRAEKRSERKEVADRPFKNSAERTPLTRSFCSSPVDSKTSRE